MKYLSTLLCFLLSVIVWSQPAQNKKEKYFTTVQVNLSQWFSTGVYLKKGTRFRVEASGNLTNNNAGTNVPKEVYPDGYGHWNWYVLAAKNGKDSKELTHVGSKGDGYAKEDGILYLGAPRSQNIFPGDNEGTTGFWSVKVFANDGELTQQDKAVDENLITSNLGSNINMNVQGAYHLKFNRVKVFNSLNENGIITNEKYDENGGQVEITVNGKVFGLCPGGSEKLRFNWNFVPVNTSNIPANTVVSAKLNISQASVTSPCTVGFRDRTELWLQGSNGTSSPFTSEEMRTINGGIFNERGRITGETNNIINIKTNEKLDFDTERNSAWFEIFAGTSAGQIRYVYTFDIIRGSGNGNGNMPNISGPWLFRNITGQICSITQTGNNIGVVTEKGIGASGSFETSSTIVVDFPFARGLKGTITSDGNRLNWANGEWWQRGVGTFPDISGAWLFRNISGQECSITQNGNNIGVVTEKRVGASGSFKNNSTIVVDFPFAQGVTGTIVNNGSRINWSNGEWWQRR